MNLRLWELKNKRQFESILLVFVLVATSMIVIIPLTAPKAQAVVHLQSTLIEDGNPTYDMDGMMNGIVLWSDVEDHIISDPTGYEVSLGTTLDIPNLNWQFGNPSENVVEFQSGGARIDVYGTLITHSGPPIKQYTCFQAAGFGGWEGIYFHPGSEGTIRDVRLNNSQNGIVMSPGSTLLAPGVDGSRFENIKDFGMTMNGVTGATNIVDTNFYRRGMFSMKSNTGIGLEVANGQLNISDSSFNSHGPGLSSLHITDATVNLDNVGFGGYDQPGYSVFVGGVADNHYIRSDGASILINNNTFDTTGGQLSVIANDLGPDAADVILRNPNPPGTTFDNTTMNVTGGSSIALQWFHDVYVEDPDGNLIPNAPVWAKDRLGNPAQPPSKITDATGWARWFMVTELIQYSGSTTYLNPFNISAENNTMFGYAAAGIDVSGMFTTVIVPFNPIPNTPPTVSFLNIIPVPGGVQSGLITIEFMLDDPNIGDAGNLSVLVEFWDPVGGMGWVPVVLDPSSDPTTNLNNNTLYTVVWVSDDPSQFQGVYATGVKIKITPYDKGGVGTPSESGTFTIDNESPIVQSGPFVTVINDIAFINWTVHEPADAVVWYGFTPNFPNQKSGTVGSTTQSVTLTGIQPGREYTYVIESTDLLGNKFTSAPYTFKTEVRIQLYKGWNMISILPFTDSDLVTVLSPIAGEYDVVQTYIVNDTNDPWKQYIPGKPSGNDLELIHGGMGLWIHMKNDAVFIPDHTDPTTVPLFPGYFSIQLEPGWNFVSYPSITTLPIDSALTGVPYDMVETYDAKTDQWLSYDGSSGFLTQMEMGRGYWIHCTGFYLWDIDYV
jgi:hypothetical protein